MLPHKESECQHGCIFIAKVNDFNVKQRLLKAKTNVILKLSDVTGQDENENPYIYINSQLTPFFGKLLSAGRKAAKERKVHSIWLNRHGCQVRLVTDGPEMSYNSETELIR